MAFHQGDDMTVFRATQVIPFPMTRYSVVLYFRRPFPDRDGIRDLTARVFKDARVARAADAALGPQMPQQLFFQHSAGLDEQATVNGLVRHAQALIIGILGF